MTKSIDETLTPVIKAAQAVAETTDFGDTVAALRSAAKSGINLSEVANAFFGDPEDDSIELPSASDDWD